MPTVMDLVWPIRRPKPEGLETVANRIAAGDPPPPEESVAVLDANRCEPADLQRAVDRHVRVLELRRLIADAEPNLKRFAAVDSEINAATAAVQNAIAAAEATVARLGREHLSLKMKAQQVSAAKDQLVEPENLPPADAAALQSAIAESESADTQVEEARDALTRARKSFETAEEALDQAEQEAFSRPRNEDAQAEAKRWQNAVVARKTRLEEAQSTLRAAEALAGKLRQRLAETREAIAKQALG